MAHDSTETDLQLAVLIERTENENEYHYSAQLPAEQKCKVWLQDNFLYIEGEPVNGHFKFVRQLHLPQDASRDDADLSSKLNGKTFDFFLKRKKGDHHGKEQGQQQQQQQEQQDQQANVNQNM